MSSLQNANIVHAAGSITAAGTALWTRSCTITDSGVGNYQINLDEAIDSAECVVITTVRGATSGCVRVVQTSDTAKQILAFAGADGTTAQDTDVDFVILRAPQNG